MSGDFKTELFTIYENKFALIIVTRWCLVVNYIYHFLQPVCFYTTIKDAAIITFVRKICIPDLIARKHCIFYTLLEAKNLVVLTMM